VGCEFRDNLATERLMHRVAAVVLAAGGSRRMGAPKQLLRLGGESLVGRAARTALASRCAQVFVVVGADHQAVTGEIRDLALTPVYNPCWREGVGASIRAGITAVAATEPPLDAALITLMDQPGVTPALLDEIITAAETAPGGLVACEYAGTVGAPALFAQPHFDALRELRGDRGGKAVLAAHAEVVVRIAFPPAAIDIDTPADYARFTRRPRARDRV
jgi:molybdenum cofactor cytidylyltransferase